MKKLFLYSAFIFLFAATTSCSPPAAVSVSGARPPQDSDNGSAPVPQPDGLDGLKAGVLPDPSLSVDEKRLAGFLERKPNPSFPLKTGLVFYKETTILSQSSRTEIVESFKQALSSNENISQIVEIPASLISANTTIEDIRNIGARFQVSTILVINDSYQGAAEDKSALVTPIDVISGIRTWVSSATVEAFALDVLNGVVVFSTSAVAKESNKFSSENQRTRGETLIKSSAEKAWSMAEEKIAAEIAAYKNRAGK